MNVFFDARTHACICQQFSGLTGWISVQMPFRTPCAFFQFSWNVFSLHNQKRQPVTMETRSELKTRSSAGYNSARLTGLKRGRLYSAYHLWFYSNIFVPLRPSLQDRFRYSSSNGEPSWRQMFHRCLALRTLPVAHRNFHHSRVSIEKLFNRS